MIPPGKVVFRTADVDGAIPDAQEFCRTRGLTTDNAKIARRYGNIEVEIRKPCLLKVAKGPKQA